MIVVFIKATKVEIKEATFLSALLRDSYLNKGMLIIVGIVEKYIDKILVFYLMLSINIFGSLKTH